VRQAEGGAAALEQIRQERPDVVLLDLRMEDMDGITMLEQLRQTDENLPVIILTGHGGLQDAIHGIHLRIVDFIQKPVDVEELAVRIRKLLSRGAGAPLRERTIGELMVPASSYRHVLVDDPLAVVVGALKDSLFRRVEGRVTEHGHRTVVVIDREQRFVGLIHVHDVLRLLVPPYLRQSPYASYFTGMFLAQLKLLGRETAADLLHQPPRFEEDAPLMLAVHMMSSHRLINVAVMRGGELVGILRDKDLLLELAGSLNGEPEATDREAGSR
jgi:CheY-like chemotaxis protein